MFDEGLLGLRKEKSSWNVKREYNLTEMEWNREATEPEPSQPPERSISFLFLIKEYTTILSNVFFSHMALLSENQKKGELVFGCFVSMVVS